jgi:hypothetical protein
MDFLSFFKDAARAVVDFAKNNWKLLAVLGLGGVAAAVLLALAPNVGDLGKAGDAGGDESANVGTIDPDGVSPKDDEPPKGDDKPSEEQFVLTGTVVRAPDGRHGIEKDGTIYLPYYDPMQRMLGQFTGRIVSMTVHKAKPRENEIRLGEVPVFVHSLDINASATYPIELSEDVTVPGSAEVKIVWGDRGRFKIEYQGVQGWVSWDDLDIDAPVANPSGYSVPETAPSAPSQTRGMTQALLPDTK